MSIYQFINAFNCVKLFACFANNKIFWQFIYHSNYEKTYHFPFKNRFTQAKASTQLLTANKIKSNVFRNSEKRQGPKLGPIVSQENDGKSKGQKEASIDSYSKGHILSEEYWSVARHIQENGFHAKGT